LSKNAFCESRSHRLNPDRLEFAAGLSDHEGPFQIEPQVNALVFHPPPPVRVQEVKPQAVLLGVDDSKQTVFEAGELRRVNLALENGVLGPLFEVLPGLGNARQPLSAGGRGGRYVIGHEDEHDKLSTNRRAI
jgi:hypothetical protein